MLKLIAGVWKSSARGKWGLVLVGFLLAAAAIGPTASPYDPNALDTSKTFEAMSWANPLGTDSLGRDILTRLLHGSRLSLRIAVMSVAFAAFFGHVFGMAAGYLGGAVDIVVGRVTDMFFAIPDLLLAIGLIAILGASEVNVAFAVGFGFTPLYVRVVRSAVVQSMAQDFVTHSRALGLPWWRVLLKDVWPTTAPTVLVQSTMMIGFAIVNEAGLGFLGLGVQPPRASWGSMLTDGRRFMLTHPLPMFAVGAALVIAVFGLNLLSDGVRDAMDPRVNSPRRTTRRARALARAGDAA